MGAAKPDALAEALDISPEDMEAVLEGATARGKLLPETYYRTERLGLWPRRRLRGWRCQLVRMMCRVRPSQASPRENTLRLQAAETDAPTRPLDVRQSA